jgi:hypothetical protein
MDSKVSEELSASIFNSVRYEDSKRFGQNAELLNVKGNGTHSYCCAMKS